MKLKFKNLDVWMCDFDWLKERDKLSQTTEESSSDLQDLR
jgi:hypothetical protein